MRSQNLPRPLFEAYGDLQIGGGALHRYREAQRYGETGRYREFAVGQGPGSAGAMPQTLAAPVAGPSRPEGCIWETSEGGAGHGRVSYPEHRYACDVKPPRCNCQVIGGNTLNSPDFATGVAVGATWTVTLDSGDASFFVPYYIHLVVFEAGAPANLAIANSTVLPTILQNSRSGQRPNLRRSSLTDLSFGIMTTVYGQDKDIECVDWNRFASVNNQQLTMEGQNIAEVATHVFVNIWGLAAVS